MKTGDYTSQETDVACLLYDAREGNASCPAYTPKDLETARKILQSLKNPRHEVLDAGREHVKATPAMMTAAWNAMLDVISPADHK